MLHRSARLGSRSLIVAGVIACAGCGSPAQEGGRWTPIALKGDIGLGDAGGVWTGSEMIVWGGVASGTVNSPGPTCDHSYCGRGAAYSPATDTWRDLSNTDAPAGRVAPTAVWTGTEMIIWGGRRCTADQGCPDGGAYDPAADTWRRIDSQGIATPRALHTAAWTGTEMIVFGGEDPAYADLAAPAAYDPANATWRRLPTEGAPSPRPVPLSFWTGEELLVWGGATAEGGRVVDGAAFDPVANTWRPLPSSGLAPGWYQGTWSGTEMILWNGVDTIGAAYRPATDDWRRISTRRASPATGPASWTGSQMIVWGGTEEDSPGGAYDPVADSWVSLTTRGQPAPRTSHQAHWTGTGMIIFGGFTPFSDEIAAPPPDCIFTF